MADLFELINASSIPPKNFQGNKPILISESKKLDYKDLIEGYNEIVREFPLPEFQVSIVHGQMKTEDKEYEMQRFVEGKTNIMVATTVIEVGVDVPNASVIVIEISRRTCH